MIKQGKDINPGMDNEILTNVAKALFPIPFKKLKIVSPRGALNIDIIL